MECLKFCTIYVYFKPEVQSTIKYIIYIREEVQFWEEVQKNTKFRADDSSLEVGIRVMSNMILDYLQSSID